MNDKRKVLEVDTRRRVTLGKLAEHNMYIVDVEPGGVITLTPAVVVPRPGRGTVPPNLEFANVEQKVTRG